MINWQYFPKSDQCPDHLVNLVAIFEKSADSIDSEVNDVQVSNDVLAVLRPDMQAAGYIVETGKKANEKVTVPVLFGANGSVDKYFDADAWDKATGTVVEVEAGRALANNQFLKDLFQACMMADVRYLCIAVRNAYKGSNDWDRVVRFFDTLYASRRLSLPLDGILVVGY